MGKHKISKKNCEWMIFKEKSNEREDGATFLWIPQGSSVSLKDIASSFAVAQVEKVSKSGVIIRLGQ